MVLTNLFTDFFNSEKSGGFVLIACTIISLVLANSMWQAAYLGFWHTELGGHSLGHWINDGLMTIFFLLIGLELEREIYIGELSGLKNALLPVSGALGGMLVPAGIFLAFNYGTPAQDGAGIPMATDIAFSLGILSLIGNKVPASVKVFLTALAVIDDLGAIIVIAVVYSTSLHITSLVIALSVFVVLIVLNRLKVHNLVPYFIGGIIMWYFMMQSGIHASIAGVLLAFAIPFGSGDKRSPSYILQHALHKPVAFFIMPIFALANTGIIIHSNWFENLTGNNSIGIFAGLVVGKPAGILLFCLLAVVTGISSLPEDIQWKHLAGAGMLAGIGFTMSIFITHLAYADPVIINDSKLIVLLSSFTAAIAGFVWLGCLSGNKKINRSLVE